MDNGKVSSQDFLVNTGITYIFRPLNTQGKRLLICHGSFLPSMACKMSRELALAILHMIFVGRKSCYAGMAPEMYKTILRHAGARLLLKPEELMSEPTWDPYGESKNVQSRAFIMMMEEGYINNARAETSKLVEETCALLASDTKETARMLELQPVDLINALLRPLTIGLSTHHVEPLPSVQKLFKKCLRRICETAPKEPPTSLHGWAHRRRGCSTGSKNVCKDCKEMDKFLASTTDQVWKFAAGEHRRKHISSRLCSSMYTLATIKEGSPYTLVVRKNEPEEDRVQREYSAKMEHINSILEPLRIDYVKELLGEATYKELIMLGRTSKLKREAESSPGSASKRQRR